MSPLRVLRIVIAALIGGLVGHLWRYDWNHPGVAVLLTIAVAAYVLSWFVHEASS